MRDEALKQNTTAANPNVNDSALVVLYQNLHAVKTTSKKRSNSFQPDRRVLHFRPNNCSGGYGGPYQASPLYQQRPFPPRYGPPASGYGQGHQGGRNPGRGGQGFPSHGGRGGRDGRCGAARSTGVCCAEEEAPHEPDNKASNPPDLDACAEEHHAEQCDDSFFTGVQEHPTPPGHYEAYYDDSYKGPHPWDHNEDYGEC